MSSINLLPWREDLRQVKNKNFLATLTITVLISGFIVFCASKWLGYRIDVLNINVGYMEESLKVVNSRIKQIQNLKRDKQELLDRMQVIRSLEFDRISAVKLLDMIPRLISNDIYLLEIDRVDNAKNDGADGSQNNLGVFDNLSKMIVGTEGAPSDALKSAVDKKQYLVMITGVATSNGAISTFIKDLSDLKWVSNVQLNKVKESVKNDTQNGSGFEFDLQFLQNLHDDQD